jgi:hypothetical protein
MHTSRDSVSETRMSGKHANSTHTLTYVHVDTPFALQHSQDRYDYTHAHTHTHTHTHKLSFSLTHSLSHSLTLSLTHTHPHCLAMPPFHLRIETGSFRME